MEYTDVMLLNMMKYHLLTIYQEYAEEPARLDNPIEKKGYESLVSVKTIDDFIQWQKLLKVIGLSFTEHDLTEVEDNILGRLDDMASKASGKVMGSFIQWKNEFSPKEWIMKFSDNHDTILKVLEAVKRDYDVHIILFRCNNQFAAIGADADRLFEIFGWQTGSVFDGEDDISFMYINNNGFVALSLSGYSVKVLNLGDIEIISGTFNDHLVSCYQQGVDCMRAVSRSNGKVHELLKYSTSFNIPQPSHNLLAKAEIGFDDNLDVFAMLENGEEVKITEGSSWRLDDLGQSVLYSLGNKIGEA